MTEPIPQTVRFAPAVYTEVPAPDDPAETFHEASKLSPATTAYELRGAARLFASAELRASAARAVRRHPLAEVVALGRRTPLPMRVDAAIAARRSVRIFDKRPLARGELAALLHAGYGVTGELEAEGEPVQPVRAVPSGGALYPLELFAIVRRVSGLTPGIYHYDPLANVLERCARRDADLTRLSPYDRELESAAASLVIAATFWRSRFKYGLRAYRFTLLEAGHLAQNLLLAATALDLASFPLGGFYDRRLDALLGLDGVDESSLAMVCVGRAEPAP